MIRLDDVFVRAGLFRIAGVSFEIGKGECVALMGKSGSGKTTIMEAVCGLREVVHGRILIGDEDRTFSQPSERNVGLVPQDNVLFMTMTVREHLAYGPLLKKWDKPAIEKRVQEVAKELRIEHLLDRKPRWLSGGEAKRVAIGRAIAAKPDLLCLDESFTGLDDETLTEVMNVVKETIKHEQISTLLITHHESEANYLADTQFHIQDDGSLLKRE